MFGTLNGRRIASNVRRRIGKTTPASFRPFRLRCGSPDCLLPHFSSFRSFSVPRRRSTCIVPCHSSAPLAGAHPVTRVLPPPKRACAPELRVGFLRPKSVKISILPLFGRRRTSAPLYTGVFEVRPYFFFHYAPPTSVIDRRLEERVRSSSSHLHFTSPTTFLVFDFRHAPLHRFPAPSRLHPNMRCCRRTSHTCAGVWWPALGPWRSVVSLRKRNLCHFSVRNRSTRVTLSHGDRSFSAPRRHSITALPPFIRYHSFLRRASLVLRAPSDSVPTTLVFIAFAAVVFLCARSGGGRRGPMFVPTMRHTRGRCCHPV